jgi:hypothetical protein
MQQHSCAPSRVYCGTSSAGAGARPMLVLGLDSISQCAGRSREKLVVGRGSDLWVATNVSRRLTAALRMAHRMKLTTESKRRRSKQSPVVYPEEAHALHRDGGGRKTVLWWVR